MIVELSPPIVDVVGKLVSPEFDKRQIDKFDLNFLEDILRESLPCSALSSKKHDKVGTNRGDVD
jgi:hypothetical protein